MHDTIQWEHELTCSKDVTQAVEASRHYALELGYDHRDSRLVAGAVSEIAGNSIKHAHCGHCVITYTENGKGIEIAVRDCGPGIADVSRSLVDGHSTVKGSLGVGLGAASRSVDELIIDSQPDHGTHVILRKYLPIPDSVIRYGVVSVPCNHEHVNGDAYVVKEFEGDTVLMAIIDGSGKGPKANAAARLIKDIIVRSYKLPLTAIVEHCHATLIAQETTRGGALGLALIRPHSLSVVGIGNVEINFLSGDMHSMVPQNGTLGYALPEVIEHTMDIQGEVSMVMNTDGIRFPLTEKASLSTLDAQSCADHLFNYHRDDKDDATVLVVKRV